MGGVLIIVIKKDGEKWEIEKESKDRIGYDMFNRIKYRM